MAPYWLVGWILAVVIVSPCLCFNHWVVTEDGRIEYQVASPFNLRQPFDLVAFIQQEERVSILKELKEELIDYKNEFEGYSEFESFDESYRASDPECRRVKLISSYDLYISTVLPLKYKGIDFLDHLITMVNPSPAEPHCTLTPLDFSMYALEHLEGVQGRRGLVAPPEKSVLASVDMRMEVFGSLVHYALEKNATSWVLLNLATLYWRARGNPFHAVECIRRALHYSPYNDRDIAYLNLANVLHRSQHSQEAVRALHLAINLSPFTSVLHFTLGNIFASMDRLNESVNCFKQCCDLDPTCQMSRERYFAALCAQRMEEASKERTEKLDETQKKLDLFYDNMSRIREIQAVGVADEVEEEVGGVGISGLGKAGQRKSKKKRKIDDGSKYGNGMHTVDATPVLDPDLSTSSVDEARKSKADQKMEEALDQVLNLSESKGGEDSSSKQNHTDLSADGEVKRTRSNFRLVLKPLPPEEVNKESSGNAQQVDGSCTEECLSVHPGSDEKIGSDDQTGSDEKTGSGEDKKSDPYKDEIAVFDHIEPDFRPVSNSKISDQSKLPTQKEYPLNYHSLEFLPYNPLPDQLEAAIFPRRPLHPLPLHDDPYWPRKKECLDLVKDLKGNPQLVSYTGTFITPEARGANIRKLFLSVPMDLPAEVKRRPYCTDIVDLPHSMATMDHLEPIMYRSNFRDNPQMGERGLRKILIAMVRSGSEIADLTFEGSAERVNAAMVQNGANWVLFDIASLYWRVRGDATNSIECLRRAVHFAPRGARDVGYIGLANVLLRHGYFNEAVIMARAGLDISEHSPVGHYTLAHIYLGLRDYVAASLHLRAALHAQPVFSYALSSLKMVRCSLKFKEEQIFLRQKMKEEERVLLQKQETEIINTLKEAIKSGKKPEKKSQPAIIIENKEPPEIPELSMGDMVDSTFTGEDALRYLARLTLSSRKKRALECDGTGEPCEGRGSEGVVKGEGKDEEENVKGDGKDDDSEADGMKKCKECKEEGSEKEMAEGEGDVESSFGNDKMKEGKSEEEASAKEVESRDDSTTNSLSNDSSSNSPSDSGRGGSDRAPPKPKKRRKSKKKKRKKTQDDIKKAIFEEIDRETRELIREAAEALNRNQTPVKRETPPKVYRMPPKERKPSKIKNATPTKNVNAMPTKNIDTTPTEVVHATPTKDINATPTNSATPTKVSSEGGESSSDVPMATVTPVPSKRPTLPKIRKTREQLRDEEIKKRFPGTRPWPTLEECEEKPLPKTVVFTSTWLSVTAKGINVREHIDFRSAVSHHMQLPYCHNDFEQSKKTLSHLTGMNHHPLIQYKAEKGLQEVLCTLDGLRRPLDEMATRIKMAMDKNSTSWVISNLAALYWRIVGQGQLAIRCLKHALYYSHDNARDVALVSLSNVLYRSGFDIDATVVIHMSLEFSPTLVVNHFTMANILAAQGLYVEAAGFYESTLHFQPEFQPAADRLRTVRCLILAARKNMEKKKKK